MKLTIIALNAVGTFYGLPDGGSVKAGQTKEFTLQHQQSWDNISAEIKAAQDAGDISSYTLTPEDGEDSGREFSRKLTVGFADASDVGLTKTVADARGALPVGAVLTGFRKNVNTVFGGGSISAVTADVGFDGASLGDVLDDGQSVLAATGETYGAGTNALPNASRGIGGKTLQAAFTAVGGNLDTLTQGEVEFEIFYKITA